MKNNLTLWTFLTLLTLYSCSSGDNYKEVAADVLTEQEVTERQKANNKVETPIERKIIKQGEISFETADVKATKSLITKVTDDLGGYISKDNVYDYQDRISHHLVIRIPADQFDHLLTKISESAEKLNSKNIDVLDVTEEYIDVEARIRTKKELENRFMELLGQAGTVEEILSIEKEIGTLRTEIESIEGRLRYLKDRIGFSTLTVDYYQSSSAAFVFSAKFGQALSTGWDWLLAFVIGLTHLWPFILIVGGAIFVALRIDRKRKNKK